MGLLIGRSRAAGAGSMATLPVARRRSKSLRLRLTERGILRTYAVLYCPGCGLETRRLPFARKHTCVSDRAARRRIARSVRKRKALILNG